MLCRIAPIPLSEVLSNQEDSVNRWRAKYSSFPAYELCGWLFEVRILWSSSFSQKSNQLQLVPSVTFLALSLLQKVCPDVVSTKENGSVSWRFQGQESTTIVKLQVSEFYIALSKIYFYLLNFSCPDNSWANRQCQACLLGQDTTFA